MVEIREGGGVMEGYYFPPQKIASLARVQNFVLSPGVTRTEPSIVKI